jgi:hypothetical protein
MIASGIAVFLLALTAETPVIMHLQSGPLASLGQSEQAVLSSERRQVTLDPKVLGRFVGVYGTGRDTRLIITLDNGQLVSRINGQSPVQIFPNSETVFFANIDDTVIEFSGSDAQGSATLLTLRQKGQETLGRRIPSLDAQQTVDTAAQTAKRVRNRPRCPGARRPCGE